MNKLLGFAAIIVACAFLIRSVDDAFALNGPNLGYGANPAVSIGGTAYDGETKTLYTAPSDQDILITDLILTSTSNASCFRVHKTDLMLSSGAVLGQFETASPTFQSSYNSGVSGLSIQHAFTGGLRVPAGDSLLLVVVQSTAQGYSNFCSTSSSYGVRYMVAGQFVEP